MHLVVVGGGISGLAAAWAAQQKALDSGISVQITLLDAADQVGGKAISNHHEGGWLTESGPTGFLDNEPALDELVKLAGLTKLPANEAAAHRFLVLGGRLREIHAHPLKFLTGRILSPLGLMRMAREILVPGKQGDGDESVWEFGRRRLGKQAADRMLAPMVQGVYAGDAKKISLPAAFPRMAEMEQQYGSLFKALVAIKRAGSKGGPSGPSGTLTSFAGGLQALPLALAKKAPFTVRCGIRVESVLRGNHGQWALRLEGESEDLIADAVVLATEGPRMARMFDTDAPTLSAELDSIDHPGVTVLSLGFPPEAQGYFPNGFGCLIPRSEKPRALGFLWDSSIFSGRAATGHTLVRALYGGALDPSIAVLDSDQLKQVAIHEIRDLFGCSVAPKFSFETRWDKAIPQYNLGHLDRVARIEASLRTFTQGQGPLLLAGNSMYGVAFGKAAARGWKMGQQAVQELPTESFDAAAERI
ncbi:MAG: oxygen-dependent protoporphyrinogen oxidase [Planctomycetota bacterium]|jgi:oxygen-dependent protoporphyrinogen oxidase